MENIFSCGAVPIGKSGTYSSERTRRPGTQRVKLVSIHRTANRITLPAYLSISVRSASYSVRWVHRGLRGRASSSVVRNALSTHNEHTTPRNNTSQASQPGPANAGPHPRFIRVKVWKTQLRPGPDPPSRGDGMDKPCRISRTAYPFSPPDAPDLATELGSLQMTAAATSGLSFQHGKSIRRSFGDGPLRRDTASARTRHIHDIATARRQRHRYTYKPRGFGPG